MPIKQYVTWPACLAVLSVATVATAAEPWRLDRQRSFHVELPADSAIGEASIREHAIVWHPARQKFYLVADVVPLTSPHHPNTYETQLHLFSSADLSGWRHHGVAVPRGAAGRDFDGYGVASPAGMAYWRGRLLVPFSARKTERFTQRAIGLAISGDDPERLPWTKLDRPISDLLGEDDDAAAIVDPETARVHLYHRTTGAGGYRIVHTSTATPLDADTWPAATPVTPRPEIVRAQELTGVAHFGGQYHLFVIEHLVAGGMRIAHVASESPDGPFEVVAEQGRAIERQPDRLAYGGHFTPVTRDGRLIAAFWTAPQQGRRYGLLGHPVVMGE